MPMATPEEQREFQRVWIAKRRQAWIDANGPCAKCGSDKELEVDHIDRTQKVNHAVWSWSAVRREVELAKCQVLCRQCHMDKSIAELGHRPAVHGTVSMYTTPHKCRCELCKAAKAAYRREARARGVG